MNIVERVKKICLSPRTEWPVIADEATASGSLVKSYVIPLAGIAAIAGFIGGSLVGMRLPFVGTYRVPITTGLGAALLGVVMAVIAVFVISLVINALAPTFGAQKDSVQAFKVAAYSLTPAWIAGAFQILPALGFLAFLGALYGIYLLYLGLPRLMKCPEEKAVTYTAAVVVCAFIVMLVVGAVNALVIGTGAAGGSLLGRGASAPSGSLASGGLNADGPLGFLGQLGQQLEESSRRAEAAERQGDAAGQISAVMDGLGAILGGGRRVEPLQIDQLRPFLPESFAGMARTGGSAERTGLAGILVAKTEATYSDGGQRSVTVQIVDSGGMSGLMGLAGWVGVEEEREDSDGFERTRRVDGRLMHEKSSMRGADEFGIVLGDRFLVSATGHGVNLDALRSAVSGLDLRRLESIANSGGN